MPGRDAQCVALDPLRPEFVYCGTFGSGLWRSDDAGETWSPAGDGIRQTRVLSVAVSRVERVKGVGVVYAGSEPTAIFRSDDAGETWQECEGLSDLPSASEWSFPPRPETHHARWIETDPHVEGRLFVAVEAGALIRSLDAGVTWQDRRPGGPYDTHQLQTHLRSAGRLYSAAGDGYFESRDGGDTWKQLEEGLRHKYLWSVAVDSGDADKVIVSAAASPLRSHGDSNPESYVYRRTGEQPWEKIDRGLPVPAGQHSAVLAAHPIEPGTFFAAWERNIFRSADGGASWERLDVSLPEGSRVNEMCALVVAEM
jgi:photosystem II stability/assembly factor-like uncharacterized protein